MSCHDLPQRWMANLSKKSATIIQGHSKDPEVLAASFSPIRIRAVMRRQRSHLMCPRLASQQRKQSPRVVIGASFTPSMYRG
jgi:hypothetical protein